MITGASRGFGKAFTSAALGRGDRVAAAARDISALAGLTEKYPDAILPITFDVTDAAAVSDAVHTAEEHFDGLDVVVNNAGYGHFGALSGRAGRVLNAISDELRFRSARADRFGSYPSSSTAARIRFSVSGASRSGLLTAFYTVCADTPARWATCTNRMIDLLVDGLRHRRNATA
ncbi:SDR family NAD(P)-dependent oxidoreductase [Kribbella qitaiheensis]|uniref:SDR family NAD(P)-dependent oxidoreductase n=1 Tax=Kribbella qitaiheensis TaxID=1544730 RepID=UPI0031B57C43